MFVHANAIFAEDQPFACCDNELRAKVTCTNENVLESSVDQILGLFYSLTVVPVAISVQRSDLLQMQQSSGESFRAFFSRVRGKAVTCRFQLECKEAHVGAEPNRHVYVNYTNDIIRHVLIAGLYDGDIKRDVFGLVDVDKMALNNLVSFTEGKEVTREATMMPNVNSMSQPHVQLHVTTTCATTEDRDNSKKGKCIKCFKVFPASPFMKLFWNQQKLLSNNGCKKYHPMIIRFCLSLAFKTSSAYEELRNSNVLTLPSRRTLLDYKNAIMPKAGFNDEVVTELINTASSLKGIQRYVVLSFDEIKLQERLVYDKHSGELIGFVDLGDAELNYSYFHSGVDQLATHALVYYVIGMASDLKFSFAYFATKGMVS